jgi:hypothetical protein
MATERGRDIKFFTLVIFRVRVRIRVRVWVRVCVKVWVRVWVKIRIRVKVRAIKKRKDINILPVSLI